MESEETLTNTIRFSMKTLDICVINITNNKLTQAILEAFDRGVKVRIITDNEKCEDKGSDVYRLVEAGLDVKTDSSANICIINLQLLIILLFLLDPIIGLFPLLVRIKKIFLSLKVRRLSIDIIKNLTSFGVNLKLFLILIKMNFNLR